MTRSLSGFWWITRRESIVDSTANAEKDRLKPGINNAGRVF